ncbi:Hemolysin-type calcium-binding protein [gamma proteobacterium HdN1]|nr:Hemolysin-type calcium-binding protein [gamma proteobacterium HdN1]
MASLLTLRFMMFSTFMMEDSSLSLAYRPSFAGGNSGLSFGHFQHDVAANGDARATFESILEQSGLFDDQEINDIVDLASTPGVRASDFTSSQLSRITQALSSNLGKQTVDQRDADYFNDTLRPWIESALNAANQNPNGPGVFSPVNADYLTALSMLAAWVNRTGAPNLLSQYLRGQSVTLGGVTLQLNGAPSLLGFQNYLTHTQQFRPESQGGNGENFGNWMDRIYDAVDYGIEKTGIDDSYDIDGDGLHNDIDDDIDGDGIANFLDSTPEGDIFRDIDGDGIIDSEDWDMDGDGIPNVGDSTPEGEVDPELPPTDDPELPPTDDPELPPTDDPELPPTDDPELPPTDDPELPPTDDPDNDSDYNPPPGDLDDDGDGDLTDIDIDGDDFPNNSDDDPYDWNNPLPQPDTDGDGFPDHVDDYPWGPDGPADMDHDGLPDDGSPIPLPPPPPPPPPGPTPSSPLVLDLDGDGVETVGADSDIYFDHSGDGFSELSGFVSPDDGLLALDRNGDGFINSGQELFGNFTILQDGTRAANGFAALQEMDTNHDGVVDGQDGGFSALRVFRDSNQNGVTDDGELLTLEQAGVTSLSLGYTSQSYVDAEGNEHRQVGSYTTTSGQSLALTDVWFDSNPTLSREEEISVSEDISLLPNATGYGTAHSLHQAIARDETGELLSLVQQFVSSTSRTERLALVEEILYSWTGQEGDFRQFYQSPIDARKIGALEAFYGYNVDRPRGSGQQYSRMYEGYFENLVNGVFYELSAQSYLKPFFAKVSWSYNAESDVWEGNFSRVVKDLFDFAQANPAEAQSLLSDFAQSVLGVNVYNRTNIDSLLATIDLFVQSDLISAYSPEAVSLVLAATMENVIEENGVIYGDAGNNYLFGLDGNDQLSGNAGNDVLDGGTGDDVLIGGSGNDQFRFGVGYGHDRVRTQDTVTGRYDVISIVGGITAADVSITRQADDLVISILGTDDVLRVEGHFSQEGASHSYVDAIVFSDGTTINVGVSEFNNINVSSQVISDADNEIHGTSDNDVINALAGNDQVFGKTGDDEILGGAGNDAISGDGGADRIFGGTGNDQLSGGTEDDVLYGESGHDTLSGDAGNDILVGSTGDDLLIGGAGNDIYLFNVGDGLDVIDNRGSSNDDDVLRLGEGIRSQDVKLWRSGNNLVIEVNSGTDEISVSNYFSPNAPSIDRIIFQDAGSELSEITSAQIEVIVKSATEGSDQLHGTAGIDVFDGLNGDDTIYGHDGNDTLSGSGGNDTLMGGYANDVLRGGEGNDSLNGENGNDTLDGGVGDDYLSGGAGSDTYLIDANSGSDVIQDYDATGNDYDKVSFGSGITAQNLTFSRKNNDVCVTVNYNGDQSSFVIANGFANAASMVDGFWFSNGWYLTGTSALAHAAANWNGLDSAEVMNGYSGNDTIYGNGGDDNINGGDGSDVLVGGHGNDYLTGGAGRDTYRFDIGDGHDVISGSTNLNEDRLELGSTTSLGNVGFRRVGDNLVVYLDSNSTITVQSYFSANDPARALSSIRLGDGTVLSRSDVIANLPRTGTSQADAITLIGEVDDSVSGLDGDDSIAAMGGNDTVNGNAGNDRLDGGFGNDIVVGGDGQDTLIGGTGSDTLQGGYGSDTYRFNLGDGQDRIEENMASGAGTDRDRIVFGTGISENDLIFSLAGRDLVITIGSGGDQIVISNSYASDNYRYRIEELEFADGAVVNVATLLENNLVVGSYVADQLYGADGTNDYIGGADGDDTLNGLTGNDRLMGGAGNDTLMGGDGNDELAGGVGNDSLQGSYGSDTYRFNQGDGQDWIEEYMASNGTDIDRIVFGAGIAVNDLTLSTSGNHLVITVGTNGDSLTINNWYTSSTYRVETFELADGTVLTAQSLLEGRMVSGTETDDTVRGNETYNDQLAGGGGNDNLYGYGGNDSLDGGAGNDTLSGEEGNDTLIGGTGNDTLQGSYGSDTYRFNLGYGQDRIEEYMASNGTDVDRIAFGAGITANDLALSVSGNNLVITVGTNGDSLTINNWYNSASYRVEEFELADGTLLNAQSLLEGRGVSGSEVAETIHGNNSYNDQLAGRGGNDTLYGYAGDDLLDGGTGDDTLSGAEGNDTLIGGVGNDTLQGSYGSDTYRFNLGDGQDRIEEYMASNGTDIDRIVFGAGITANDLALSVSGNHLVITIGNTGDSLTINNWYSSSTYRVEEFELADGTVLNAQSLLEGRVVSGSESAETIHGNNSYNDQLAGRGGNDTLYGYAGDDLLDSGTGDDTLSGAEGNDSLIGGAGNDILQGSYGSDTYRFNLGDGQDRIEEYMASNGTDIDRIVFGAGIFANDLALSVSGNNLVITVGNSGDSLTINNWYSSSNYRVEEFELADGTVLNTQSLLEGFVVAGTDAADTVYGNNAYNDQLAGGGGNDNLYGYGGDDRLNGGADNDTLSGAEGNDTLNGGIGNDTLQGSYGSDTYCFNLGDGQDRIEEYMASNGTDIDRIVFGAGIAANDLALSVSGNNLVITVGSNGDSLTISNWYSSSNYRVEEFELDDGTVLNAQSLLEGHVVSGNDLANTLYGNDVVADWLGGGGGNDTLYGYSGNDMLDGGVGNDTLVGGIGNDTYVVDSLSDVVTESASQGIDTVNSSITWVLGTNLENLTLFGNGAINGTGNTLNNIITGNDADNVLTGGRGSDVLIGRKGNDTYVVDDINYQIVEAEAEGTDVVQSSLTWTLAQNVENLTLTGTTAINGTGNQQANSLIGNSASNRLEGLEGNDVLDGGAGADAMVGGLGDDIYYLENTADKVIELAQQGMDTIYSKFSYTLVDNAENLVLQSGLFAFNATGNALDNTITGNDLYGNIIDGKAGADTMMGLGGGDTYIVDNANDQVIENVNAGTDLVRASVTFSLSDNVENLVLTGASAISGNGNQLNNQITGNSAANTLDGKEGTDILTGGAGNDAYLMGRGYGSDTIVENDALANTDVLQFGQDIAADQLWFQRVNADLEVSIIGTSDKVTISNWYGGQANHVEQFTTAGGLSLSDASVDALVNAMAAFAPPAPGQVTLPQEYQQQLNGVIAANWR